VVTVYALTPEVLRSTGAVPAYVAGQFRQPAGFQQSASGQYFVFDRRAHTVYGLDAQQSSAWEIVKIGGESGRIIDPTAFAVEPNGTFVVADAPNNRERIQIFTPAGFRIGGFLLPGCLKTRVVIENAVLNGIGSLQSALRSDVAAGDWRAHQQWRTVACTDDRPPQADRTRG
jgi:hypothetical protein